MNEISIILTSVIFVINFSLFIGMNHRIVSDNTHDLNGITQIIVLINGIALSYSIPKTKKIILSEKTKTEKEKINDKNNNIADMLRIVFFMWRLLFLLSLRFLTKCGYATFSIVIINVVITLVTFSDGTKKPTDLAPPKKPNNDDDMVIIIPCELLYKNTLNHL